MNHHDANKHDANKRAANKHVPNKHDCPKLSPEDEREWRLQERAMHDERPASAEGDDPLLSQYRFVADALQRQSSEVPADFVASVLDAVHSAPADASAGLERWLLRGLFAVFFLSGLAAAAIYGGQWLQGFVLLWSQAPATSHNWLLALGACIAMSWSLRLLRWPHAPSKSG